MHFYNGRNFSWYIWLCHSIVLSALICLMGTPPDHESFGARALPQFGWRSEARGKCHSKKAYDSGRGKVEGGGYSKNHFFAFVAISTSVATLGDCWTSAVILQNRTLSPIFHRASFIPPTLLLYACVCCFFQVVSVAAFFEDRMVQGSKEIFHLEAFVAKFMAIYKQYLVNLFAWEKHLMGGWFPQIALL